MGERYFSKGGRYILDAGSGPLIDEAVVAFGDRFERFICTDLSTRALSAARAKLGERGIYLKSDITNLPIEDGVVDAITCNHVIYQLPLAYGATSASHSAYHVEIPNVGYYGFEQDRTNTVDGWGVITTPGGSFDVLRVKTT